MACDFIALTSGVPKINCIYVMFIIIIYYVIIFLRNEK